MSAVEPNRRSYLVSLAEELRVQANRIRNLIGSAHWLTDGHHKEYLLAALLRRHLPQGIMVSRGFVVAPRGEQIVSKEQDLLVVDANQEAPLFNQNDVVVVFPETVLAAVSVKTTLKGATLADSIKGLSTVRELCNTHLDVPHATWCGAFFFGTEPSFFDEPNRCYEHLATALRTHKTSMPTVHTSVCPPAGPDMVATLDGIQITMRYSSTTHSPQRYQLELQAFRAGDLAAANFLVSVLDHVSARNNKRLTELSDFADSASLTPLAPACFDL